jgi:hypothetical protein
LLNNFGVFKAAPMSSIERQINYTSSTTNAPTYIPSVLLYSRLLLLSAGSIMEERHFQTC